MKVIAHVPCQQYGFFEFEGTENDLPKIEKFYQNYAEYPLSFKKGVYKEFLTFTGETIRFNEETHSYEDLEGNKLISGSQFKKQFDEPFDKEKILPMMEKKYGVKSDIIDAMWTANSKISTTFGTAVHLAIEQWFKHNKNGTQKEYHLPKQIFLRNVVDTFPLKNMNVLPELLVSCVKKKMAGQIDGLVITGEKQGYVIDIKTDSDIIKNLTGHFIQLSFYARILQENGWVVPFVEVWNFTDKWEASRSEVIDITKITKESIKEYEKSKKAGVKVANAKKSGASKNDNNGLPGSDEESDRRQEGTKE